MLSVHTQLGCIVQQAIVPRRERHRIIFSPNYIFVVLLFLALGFQLWVRLAITQEGYRLERYRIAALQSDTRLRQLKFEYERRTSPSVLLQRAEIELAMHPLAPKKMRKITRQERR